MSDNKISYLNRNYADFRDAFMKITKQYYPDILSDFSDASIGQWFIELIASAADDLSYHIDRTFQETDINSAQKLSSLMNIARTNGVKIPGREGAICEVELSCNLPLYKQGENSNGNLSVADESYAPVIKRGTLFSTGIVMFELTEDVDFSEQFDNEGISNRTITPVRDSNGNITAYKYTKTAIARAGQSKIYKKVIEDGDIKPFMEVMLQDDDILGVDSIIVKDGTDLTTDPIISDFNVDAESYKDQSGKTIQRYFEVDSLVEQYRFGHELQEVDINNIGSDGALSYEGDYINNYTYTNADSENLKYYNPIWENYTYNDEDGNEVVYRRIAKGKWKRLKNKFITEYTNNWNLKIIFGAGIRNEYGNIPTKEDGASNYTQYLMSRMQANDYMGVLPESGKTMYVLYRVGGGESSNIAKNTLTNIVYINYSICGNTEDSENTSKIKNVQTSISVTNTSPSYGGKDEPTEDELRYIIKYNSASQNRCVTINDYYSKIESIPAEYGCPFRFGIVEENNKIVIYALGLDYNGNLKKELSKTVSENMKEYLSKYKMINDFIEIRSGKIINLKFEIDIFIEKSYDKSEVSKRVIEKVADYMDIRHHDMGEDIFLGDLNKELGKLDGVLSVIKMKVYNPVGNGYSSDSITQELIDPSNCCYSEYDESETNYNNQIDLDASDMVLYNEANSMFEILNENDIVVRVKQR